MPTDTTRRSDAEIFGDARKALDERPTVPQGVDAHVVRGVVTLTGSVRHPFAGWTGLEPVAGTFSKLVTARDFWVKRLSHRRLRRSGFFTAVHPSPHDPPWSWRHHSGDGGEVDGATRVSDAVITILSSIPMNPIRRAASVKPVRHANAKGGSMKSFPSPADRVWMPMAPAVPRCRGVTVRRSSLSALEDRCCRDRQR